MQTFFALTKRNIKLYFKDKGMFFSSLITPLILLVLYATFLAKVYRNSFSGAIPQDFHVENLSGLIDGMVGAMLLSSLLAVCCVTVAFCSNLVMVQDKYTGVRKDLLVTPVKKSVLSLSYFAGTYLNTLIVCFIACAAGFVYLAVIGWYMSFADVCLVISDVMLLALFGTALSSIVNSFLTSQGQMSAVGTVVSAGYGFICGAYMPLSNFSGGLQKVISFLPGTYGTSLLRNHALRGVYAEMADIGFPPEIVESINDSIDCNIYFFGTKVGQGTMYIILTCSIVVFVGIYILMNVLSKAKKHK